MSRLNHLFLIVLALVFSAGLIFASIELPELVDQQIKESVNFPGYDHTASDLNISRTVMYIHHFHLRAFGYIGLGIIITLIVMGFSTGKTKYSLLGTIGTFLPIFGHFAVTMFFLAGLGFLRLLWFPLTDISPLIMRLGDILLMPYTLLINMGDHLHSNWRNGLPIIFIVIGVVLFTLGVYVWFITRATGKQVAVSRVYRISRHPQYLGWMLWSYGLYFLPVNQPKKAWEYNDSLPLLLTFIVIICIALIEEVNMKKGAGNMYEDFAKKTTFLIPLPKKIQWFFMWPHWILFGKNQIQRKREAIVLCGFHMIILMALSYVYIGLFVPTKGIVIFPQIHKKRIEHLAEKLANGETRRIKDLASMDIERYGDLAIPYLVQTIASKDASTLNYTIRALGNIGEPRVCMTIIECVEKCNVDVRHEACSALAKLKCPKAEPLFIQWMDAPEGYIQYWAARGLIHIQADTVESILLNRLHQVDKYTRTDFICLLGLLKSKGASHDVAEYLYDSRRETRMAAIIALARIGNSESIPVLLELKNDPDWEIRMITKEAIKMMKRK